MFAWQGRGRRGANGFGEGLVEVGEVGVALLYDVGPEGEMQSDVVLCEWFGVRWGRDGGCWDGDFDGRCHGRSRSCSRVSIMVSLSKRGQPHSWDRVFVDEDGVRSQSVVS